MKHQIRTVAIVDGDILAVNSGYAAVRIDDRIDALYFADNEPGAAFPIVENAGYDNYFVNLLNSGSRLTSVEIRHVHRPNRGCDRTELKKGSTVLTRLPHSHGHATGTPSAVYFLVARGDRYDLLRVDARTIEVAAVDIPLPFIAENVDLRVSFGRFMIAYSIGRPPGQRRLLHSYQAKQNWETLSIHPHRVRRRSVYEIVGNQEKVASDPIRDYWMTREYSRIGDRLAWVEGHGHQWRIRYSADRREREHLALPYVFDEVGEFQGSDSKLVLWGSVGNTIVEVTITH